MDRSTTLFTLHAHSHSSCSHSPHRRRVLATCVHIHRGARALLRRGLEVEEEDVEEAPCWALDAHGLYSAAASGTLAALPTMPTAPAAVPWGHAAPPAPAAPWGAVGAAPVPPRGAVPGGQLLPPPGAHHGAAGYPVVPKLPAPQQQPRPGGGVDGVAVPSRPGDVKRQRAR